MKNQEEKVHDYYENDASTYDRRWSKAGGDATSKIQKQIVLELSRNWHGKRIIEVGCGTGRFTSLLYELGSELTYVDLSAEMLEITRQNLVIKSSRRSEGINASAYKLPICNNTFDCALSINVFNHLHSPDSALSEIHRILNPHGSLIINFSNSRSYYWLAAAMVNSRKRAITGDVYSHWYGLNQIHGYLENSGFKILRVIGNVHVPSTFDLPVIRNFIKYIDAASRESRIKYWSPYLFFYCEKM